MQKAAATWPPCQARLFRTSHWGYVAFDAGVHWRHLSLKPPGSADGASSSAAEAMSCSGVAPPAPQVPWQYSAAPAGSGQSKALVTPLSADSS